MNEDGTEAAVDEERLKAILESLLFAAGEPVGLVRLANALDNVPRETIRKALAEMAVAYAAGGRGIALEEVANGYQLRTPKEHASYVRRLLSSKPPRLSRPLLETLSIIAYRQPITRPEIEQLRGVDTGGVLDTLLERALVKIAGRKEAPGRPMMYATTSEFLELFGLKDLESLPDLEELRALGSASDEAAAPASEIGETAELVEAAEIVATVELIEITEVVETAEIIESADSAGERVEGAPEDLAPRPQDVAASAMPEAANAPAGDEPQAAPDISPEDSPEISEAQSVGEADRDRGGDNEDPD